MSVLSRLSPSNAPGWWFAGSTGMAVLGVRWGDAVLAAIWGVSAGLNLAQLLDERP